MVWGSLSRIIRGPRADPRSGIMTQHLAPGYSSCRRCRTAWKFVDGHTTSYANGSGMFPLCELCWADLTPEERLPFYYTLFRQWEWDASQRGHDVGVAWGDIERAVLNEGAAQGIEAGTATTAGRGPKDESPVGNADAPE